ncbi:MAG TPA: proton-conducting transporter membrane subunit [Streptosporangiaceae bacterium]|nr:proton-conducting transporter membrane subunit [Streptosporangiaceae bacterium]
MTGYAVLLAAGLLLLAAGAAADLLLGVTRPRLRPVPYLLGTAASAALAVAGAGALAGRPVTLRPSGVLGLGPAGGLGWAGGLSTLNPAADRLSGLFLVIAFGAAVPVSLAFADWAARPAGPGRRGLGASYSVSLGAVAVVLTARDAFTLLFAWETLTLAFYLLAGFERARPQRPAAALVTLAFGQISGASLLAGLLLLAGRSHSLALASFTHIPAGAPRATAVTLLLAGFAVKVGLVPFQVWLPRGYAAAPGPARAIMAGVAVNVGFYGLWRTLAVLGPPPAAVTGVLLILASLTAVIGIAHAAVQTSLQRVIAYSSVENTGLILAGFGVALVGASLRSHLLVAAGLLAATLQVVAHTVAKSLLFTASAGIEADGRGGGGAWAGRPPEASTDDLDGLRGCARPLPWSGTGLAIGSLTLAGLPPTAGFVSEWFLLEALMQQFRVPGLGDRLVLAITGAAVALTAGFAGVTFVRLIGLIVLGRPAQRAAPARDYGPAGRAAIVVLAAGGLVIAALTPLEIRVIAAGLSPAVPAAAVMNALKSPWVLQPIFAGFSILSPSWLWLAMPALLVLITLLAWAASGGRLLRVRRVPPWRSATAGVSGPDSYTAFAFANPTRRVLAAVLHTRAQTTRTAAASPPAPGAGPDARQAGIAHVGYSSDVMEVVEQYVYRPLRRPFLSLVRAAQRLQSGHLSAYLAYMLIALIAVLAVVTALH